MLHSTTLCWKSAHVASRRFRNSSVSPIAIWYMRSCSIQTWLYQCPLLSASSKTQRQYQRDTLLLQKLLPEISSIAGDVFVFQQDNAHRARDTVELLCCETRSSSVLTCGQPTVLTSARVCGICKSASVEYQSASLMSCGSVLLRHGLIFNRAVEVDQWRKRLETCVSVQKVVTLNTCCDVVCLTFQLSHHNRFFWEPPTFGWKSFAFYKVVRWYFLGVVGKGVTVCFLLR